MATVTPAKRIAEIPAEQPAGDGIIRVELRKCFASKLVERKRIAHGASHGDRPFPSEPLKGAEVLLVILKEAVRRPVALLRRLPEMPVFAYLEGMEVHFTPEQETQLSQIAIHAGTDAERLVKDAALNLLQEEARFRAAVREGVAQADRGEFIEEEEMDARLEQMLHSSRA